MYNEIKFSITVKEMSEAKSTTASSCSKKKWHIIHPDDVDILILEDFSERFVLSA